ncbi:hypothetical protein ABZ422_20150 [Micromonospora zamorensis]|uniref:hypothetical protein n=1 Tax=Micromonospora zamorensis TaxID=709883 RepID=UPI0033B94A30
MPPKDRVRTDQQPSRRTTLRGAGAGSNAGRRVEPQALLAELALKHQDLVSQGEDLDVHGPVARRR